MEGLEFLIPRKRISKYDFSAQEKLYDIKLPKVYRDFIERFEVTRFKHDILFWQLNGFKYPMNGPMLCFEVDDQGNDIYSFEEFIDPENIFGLYESDFQLDEFGICSLKFIPIGISGIYNNAGGFLLGTVGETSDQIFIDTEEGEPNVRFKFIAKDIYAFIEMFTLKEINLDYVSSEISYEKLYKRWGENFWRMKEAF